ncbi:sensor histidine kinase [Streptomyces radiopugnans]|uniref:histidine kinase n=1 Tax=Streptomyces radiopugnans TaxID=403935 RepID=A0A1H9I9L6_9ACTN|nr:histidine kinase [Streptomyces radiopugnans]SEQ71257.1 Signal transduction histidine kinase [Streptomyces radiopugnans]
MSTTRPPLPRPPREDLLIAAAGLVGGLAMWALGLFNNPRPPLGGGWVLLPLAVMALAEALRRTAPSAALALGAVALAGDLVTRSLLATIVMFSDVVYAAVLYGGPRLSRAVPPASAALTAAVTVGTLTAVRDPQALLVGFVCGLITVGPAWTGVIVRDHRNAAAAERLRAEQTALLAEMDRVQAVTAERSRVARELHDVVAGHLSAIAIHATAAQSLDDRAATGDALAVIRENSVQGLAEMRRLIGLLRTAGGDEEVSAAPTLDGLDALLAHARRHGAAGGLSFALRDERSGGPLPAPVELAAYRIAQESLTNALKHASPGEVTVVLTSPGGDGEGDGGGGGEGSLTITVTSPCDRRPGPRAPGSGAGLVGMRERAELLGGAFVAGPVEAAGGTRWEVRAVLPLGESARNAADGGSGGSGGSGGDGTRRRGGA